MTTRELLDLYDNLRAALDDVELELCKRSPDYRAYFLDEPRKEKPASISQRVHRKKRKATKPVRRQVP